MGIYRNLEARFAKAGTPVIHLFGGPYVTLAGQRREVPEGSKRLLTMVALRRRRVERRHVAGILWPLGHDSRAAGNLRSALWRLRGAGIDILQTDKWSIGLSEGVAVDAQIVAEWADRLIEGTERDEDLAVSPAWIDGLDLLPGWYDDWVLIERERLRQRTLHALEALSHKLIKTGRFADAVDAAMLAVSAEPLRESAQLALIRAHVAEGNLVEARRGCRAYRDLLRRELGVDPSAELQRFLVQPNQGRPSRSRPQIPEAVR